MMALPLIGNKQLTKKLLLPKSPLFNLPELPYAYNSLEPFFDEKSLKIHHLELHNEYALTFKSIAAREGLTHKNARDILMEISQHNDELKNVG
ncbi:MAG: hypothetical protein HC906_10830, partial [Bacteroidales bacterium]|nr:hypothetical protein [Bacteroidales bacterium]